MKVADVEEAINHVNASVYGLGSAVFSRGNGESIARRLRVGMTSINDALATSQIAALPFGGRGDSGDGRKHGDEGLREFAYAHAHAHAMTIRTAPAQAPTTTFDRAPGAMARALAAARQSILDDGPDH